jgi:hypothetical protein
MFYCEKPTFSEKHPIIILIIISLLLCINAVGIVVCRFTP